MGEFADDSSNERRNEHFRKRNVAFSLKKAHTWNSLVAGALSLGFMAQLMWLFTFKKNTNSTTKTFLKRDF